MTVVSGLAHSRLLESLVAADCLAAIEIAIDAGMVERATREEIPQMQPRFLLLFCSGMSDHRRFRTMMITMIGNVGIACRIRSSTVGYEGWVI